MNTMRSDIFHKPVANRTAMTKVGSCELLGCPLCRLGEFLEHAIALELGQVIDEQNAVQVIDFVLQAGSEKPIGLDLARLSLAIEIFHLHLRRTFDVAVIFRDRQAPFVVSLFYLCGQTEYRIAEYVLVMLLFL